MLAAGLAWGLTPFTVEIAAGTYDMLHMGYSPARFGLGFLALAVLTLVWFLQEVNRYLAYVILGSRGGAGAEQTAKVSRFLFLGRLFLPGLLAAWVLGHFYKVIQRPPGILFDNLILSADLLLLAWVIFVTCGLWRRLGPVWLAAFLLLTSWGSAALSRHWHQGFAPFYDQHFSGDIFQTLAAMDPQETRLAVFGYRYYPYFGARRQFRVSRPQWLNDFPDLLRYLRAHDVTVVTSLQSDELGIRRYQPPARWLAEHPDLFTTFKESGMFFLARVNRRQLDKTGP